MDPKTTGKKGTDSVTLPDGWTETKKRPSRKDGWGVFLTGRVTKPDYAVRILEARAMCWAIFTPCGQAASAAR